MSTDGDTVRRSLPSTRYQAGIVANRALDRLEAAEAERDAALKQADELQRGWIAEGRRTDESLAALREALARLEAAEAQRDTLAEALSVIPPENLEALAMWIDLRDAERGVTGTEVQSDLRRMARLARAALAGVAPPEAET